MARKPTSHVGPDAAAQPAPVAGAERETHDLQHGIDWWPIDPRPRSYPERFQPPEQLRVVPFGPEYRERIDEVIRAMLRAEGRRENEAPAIVTNLGCTGARPMRSRQVKKLAKQLAAAERAGLPSLDWHRLIHIELSGDLEGYSVWLELRDGRFIRADDVTAVAPDVISLAITTAAPEVAAWDTEQAAWRLANELSRRFGGPIPVLLSRDPDSFTGYFARFRGTSAQPT